MDTLFDDTLFAIVALLTYEQAQVFRTVNKVFCHAVRTKPCTEVLGEVHCPGAGVAYTTCGRLTFQGRGACSSHACLEPCSSTSWSCERRVARKGDTCGACKSIAERAGDDACRESWW